MSVSRRSFLAGAVAAGAAGAGALSGASALANPLTSLRRLPKPSDSGVDHIVVLCMENRSFDHYLGWVKGARGRQKNLRYLDDAGVPHKTHHLTEWQGCGFNDPDHSYTGGRVQLNDGKCDGFRKGRNDDFAIGYYLEKDLKTFRQLVKHFTTCDRWFASFLGPTFPNRLYTHSAATDRISNTFTQCFLPTIWDRLAEAGVPASYYFSDLPVLALYGGKYNTITKPIDTFFADAAAGNLGGYSYLDPTFIGASQGASNDDHPHADIRRGQNLVARVVDALMESPQWANTVLMITYDEWGGFFDHVAPPRFPDDVSNPGGGIDNPDHAQAGFRVPAFIVSPFAEPGKVARMTLDHSALMKLAEWRFGLAPLTERDAGSNNPARLLDFSRPNLVPPYFWIPPDPGPHLCAPEMAEGMSTDDSMWREFADVHKLLPS